MHRQKRHGAFHPGFQLGDQQPYNQWAIVHQVCILTIFDRMFHSPVLNYFTDVTSNIIWLNIHFYRQSSWSMRISLTLKHVLQNSRKFTEITSSNQRIWYLLSITFFPTSHVRFTKKNTLFHYSDLCFF
jgi:hypothetical protein